MSHDQDVPSDRLPSPAPSISSESDIDEDATCLESVTTLAQLHENGTLKPALPEKLRFEPNPDYLYRVSLFQGNITTLKIDSIVNAANRSLLGGGGVDGAIHAAAGPKLVEECRTLNGCATGESKITGGYSLPARHIIHTVGPVYSRSNTEKVANQLESCYKTSLELAVKSGLKHVAFPSISTGIYGYPIVDATHIALKTVRTFLESEESEGGTKLDRVIFVVWSDRDKEVYESLIPEYFPFGDKPQADASTTTM